MVARLALRSKQPRNDQGPKPRPVLERLDRTPGVEGERGRKEGWQEAGVVDDPAPFVEPGSFVPVQIVNERERVVRPRRGGARKDPVRAFEQGIDRGERGRESLVVETALPFPLVVGFVRRRRLTGQHPCIVPLLAASAQGREAR